jgi:hypothetical protein
LFLSATYELAEYEHESCSETEVSEQLPLKTAVLQGFSLKNCKTCETTNRVVKQVYHTKIEK